MKESIHVNIYKDIKNISVLGEIETTANIKQLIQYMDDPLYQTLHITFYDARIIPALVIEKIVWLQQRYTCKINVFQRYLYCYLMSLGIRCEYIEPKPMEPEICIKDQEDLSINSPICHKQITELLTKIYEKYDYDYREYDINSIGRRLKKVMAQEQIHRFENLEKYILGNRDMFEKLFIEFSINTTDFFRNPEVYKQLAENIFVQLERQPHIKIWCAGCSTGEEPYSLAILLHEYGLLNKTQIYATDINPYVVKHAANGLFSIQNMEHNRENYQLANGQMNLIDYFEIEKQYMKIKEFIKKRILFFQHDLEKNSIQQEGFQLILCRNVLIYFTPELQEKVLGCFWKALKQNGFLVLGKSESLIINKGDKYFDKYNGLCKLYIKKQSIHIKNN